jgi:XTP/dITP diphosphohydrolase
MQPQSIVLASGNQKKLNELSAILSQFEVELIPQSEYQVEDAIEDGLTFVENAIIKARHACTATGKPSIADDSGIEVDYLNGQPGIYSARFSGENANDESNLNKLLIEMSGVEPAKRTARYQCVIVYMQHAKDPTPLICQADWSGVLLEHKVGDGGFGYDPIFYCPQQKMTAAQMSAEQKSAVSHRGKALEVFQKMFKQKYSNG